MVELWTKFLEYLEFKGLPMSDGDWCEEALAFAGGDPTVACALLDMVKTTRAVDSLVKNSVPGEA
jgi:hypothetical protein